MTAVELLPLPDHFAHQSERVQEAVRNYALVNVAYATVRLQAEVEALRTENERKTKKLADCFRLSGADPDGNADELLAARAVDAVRELRKDYDENEDWQWRAERAEARVAELEREVASKQARIDALMIEYCPDEMTHEQVAEWARHQRPANPTIVHCDNCGCDWVDNGINPIGCPYCKTTSGSINTSANHVRQA